MKEQKLGIEDFKRIFKENYEEFLSKYPEYDKGKRSARKNASVREQRERLFGVLLILSINHGL